LAPRKKEKEQAKGKERSARFHREKLHQSYLYLMKRKRGFLGRRREEVILLSREKQQGISPLRGPYCHSFYVESFHDVKYVDFS